MAATVQFTAAPDGVDLAWTAHGSGPALVFSRGWITHLEYAMSTPFGAFVDALASRFTIVRFDGRGNGMSDWDVPRPITFEHLVSDLECVVDATGHDEIVLWGSSWGGPAAIAFAAQHPERVSRLILDGTFADGDRLASPERRKAFLSLFDVADASPDAVFAALSHLSRPDADDATAQLADRGRRTIRPDVARELYTLLYDIDVRSEAGCLQAPTLVLHRKGSRAVPFDCARRLVSIVPDAQLIALDGTAHNPWDEGVDVTIAALEWFLDTDFNVASDVEVEANSALGQTTAVLFSDIVDSTATQSRLGDAAAYSLVQVHDIELRAAITRFGGREIKHTGDGIMAAFTSAAAAVRAARSCMVELAARRVIDPDGVPEVTVGVNVGEPIPEHDDLYGLSVAIAARVCAVAQPGQIVVTAVVRELTSGSDLDLRPLGAHQLKGVDHPVDLFEVTY